MKTAQMRGDEVGFAPVYNEFSRVLILGSYPSPKSFETGFYYGHPQNRFWPLLAKLCGEACPKDKPEKVALLERHNIALWDVLETCLIRGAADSSIQKPKPNHLQQLFEHSQIEAVFCNGATAHRLYQKYCETECGRPAVRLPSTSAANAACGQDCLWRQWQVLKNHLSSLGVRE